MLSRRIALPRWRMSTPWVLGNVCNARTVLVAPALPLFFFHCRLLRVSLEVYQLFYFVGVYRKGFPVDSSPCIYLMFLIPPLYSEFDFLFYVAGVRLVSDQRALV